MIVIIEMSSTPPGSPKKKNLKQTTPQKSQRNLLKRQFVETVKPKKQYGFYVLESNICIEDEILKKYIFKQWENYFNDDFKVDITRIYKIGTVKKGFKNRYQNPTLSFLPPHLAGWHCVAWFGVNNKEDYKTIKEIEKRFKKSHNAYLKGKGVGQTEMIFNLSVEKDIVPLCKNDLDEKNIEYEYIGKAFFSGINQDKQKSRRIENHAINTLGKLGDNFGQKEFESLKF